MVVNVLESQHHCFSDECKFWHRCAHVCALQMDVVEKNEAHILCPIHSLRNSYIIEAVKQKGCYM
jgi:hypothetical protein